MWFHRNTNQICSVNLWTCDGLFMGQRFGSEKLVKRQMQNMVAEVGYLLPHVLPLLSFILSLKQTAIFYVFVSADTRTQINLFRDREARSVRNISLCLRKNWESAVEAYCFQRSNNINYFQYILIEHLLCARHCKRCFICNPSFKP